MQPKLTLLSDEIIARILEEAYELLRCPGVKVQNPEARDLLAAAGAIMYPDNNVVGIPEALVKKALESGPREFYLYDYDGNPTMSTLTQVHQALPCSIPKRWSMTLLKQNISSAC